MTGRQDRPIVLEEPPGHDSTLFIEVIANPRTAQLVSVNSEINSRAQPPIHSGNHVAPVHRWRSVYKMVFALRTETIAMPRVQVGTRANNLIELHYQGCGSQEPVGLIHGWHGFNLPPGQERNKALIKFLRA